MSAMARRARVSTLLVMGLLGAVASGLAWADTTPEPRVRARLEPSDVIVGTEQRLVVDILVPTWLVSAPQLPEIEIPGVVALRSSENAVNRTESIDGETWSGVSTGYVLYTQRPGSYETPPDPVLIQYAVDGSTRSVSVPLPVERFAARLAPGADETVLVADAFSLAEDVAPEPKDLRVGDAIRRTVRMRAERTRAMLLPAIDPPTIDGLSAYPDSPRLVDTPGQRGGAPVAERVESTSWILERPGTYELPAVVVRWWNPRAERLETAELSAVRFEVAPSPVFTSGRGGRGRLFGWWWIVVAVLAGWLALTAVGRGWLAQARSAVGARLESWRTSERAVFGAFVRATRSGEPHRILAAFYAWLDRRAAPEETARSADLVRETGATELGTQVDGLEESLFAADPPPMAWSPGELRRAAVAARGAGRRAEDEETSSLGPLNPSGRARS